MAQGGHWTRFGDQEQAPRGIGPGPILAVGLVMLAAGALVVVHALAGGAQLPPASAQEIPRTVGTAAPAGSVPAHVAPPLSPSAPVEIEIPAIGVTAPVMRLGLNSDGTVQVPPLDNHNLAGWYDGSVMPGLEGSSVILGHVDSYAGPSVFFSIKTLRKGEEIDIVRADGQTASFSVDGVQEVSKTLFPSSAVYGNVPYPALRLITCGGPFDPARGSYLDNIVVYAHLTGMVSG